MGRPQLGFPRLRFAAVKANGIAIVPDHTPTWLFSFALYPVQSLEFPYQPFAREVPHGPL